MALVEWVNRDILAGLGDRPGTDEMMARLLLGLTTLYVQRPTHTAEEQHQYAELALRLIDKVEAPTRAAVTDILQRYLDAPAEVVARLSHAQLPHDGDPDGVTPENWGAQRRFPFTETRSDSAPDRRSERDQHSEHKQHSAEDERAPVPARSDPAPAPMQPAFIPSELGEAFFAASPAERRRLLALITRSGNNVPASREGNERIRERLDVAALHSRIGEFAREFERLIDAPKGLCERILNDPSGEPMVVAAKASAMPIAILQRILLLVSPTVSHSVQRVHDLTDLYHEVDSGAARDLLALWRTQAKSDDPSLETEPAPGDGRLGVRSDTAVASLRSRFGALTERLQRRPVNARPGPGSAARRGLRSQ